MGKHTLKEKDKNGWSPYTSGIAPLSLDGTPQPLVMNSLEACRIAACDAIKKICSTYHGVVQHSPMRFFLPMNKLAPAWHKRTTILA